MLGILEVDLAEVPPAGDGAPEAVGGASQQAATLAREGGQVLHVGPGTTLRSQEAGRVREPGCLPRCQGRARTLLAD